MRRVAGFLADSALVPGFLGVLAFSFTLPATRVAVQDLDGTVVGLGRALVAAVLAAALLRARHERLPDPSQLRRLGVVALGVIIGFPLCTSLALTLVPASHGAVFVGLIPAATAVMAVLRAGERPSAPLWMAVAAGVVAVLVFAAARGAGEPRTGDLLILLAVALCAVGYAEGGSLAREIGGWRVICWALVLAAPVLAPVVAWRVAETGLHGGADAWLGFAYVSVVSMFLGFFVWYRGLARGGIARIGQLQLAQPVLTLTWAALILGERFGAATVVAAAAVLMCAAISQRAR
ncbi:MAG TPA: DMT family transporter [Thermoleophilaceae bacterium]|jgi:drug/metabolite transporter (DMT)-like permease